MSDLKAKVKQKYRKLLAHLDKVSLNCRKIALRLIEEEKYDLAHSLVIAGQTHDLSKFYNDEWAFLCEYDGEELKTPELLKAIKDHVENNFHHPEAWEYKGGIHAMDDVSLAELVADWESRGQEFNRSFEDFLVEKAFKKYNFSIHDPVFKKINYFYNLLTCKDLFSETSEPV
jgi:hypothetical protein